MTVTARRRMGAAFAILVCGSIAWVEGHHEIPAFRAWTFGLVFLLGVAGAVAAGGRWRDGFLVLSTLFLGLCVLEVAAGRLEPKSDLKISPFWIELKPVVGFGFNKAGVIHSRKADPLTGAVVFDAHYTIGDTFDRVVRPAGTGPAVAFFGDSFTFGEGLNDADTLPQRFADLGNGERVLDLAVTGYSPQQFLREVQTGVRDAVIGPKPRAFVFLTSPFHAMRTACKESWTNNAPRFALVDDHLAHEGVCYAGAALRVHEFLQNTALYRLAIRPVVVRLTHADVDLYIRILAEAVRGARERYGVDTLVPFVRTAPNYLQGTGFDNDAVIAALRGRGVRVLDVTLTDPPGKEFTYEIRGDGHPSPAATLVWARNIADALKEPAAPAAGSTQ